MIFRLIAFSAMLALCACGTTKTTTKIIDGKAVVVDQNGEPVSETGSVLDSKSTGKIGKAPDGSESISMVYFAPNQKLYLGTRSGNLVEIDIEAEKAGVTKIATSSSVIATSPDGQYAIIDASPPAVMGVDGELVLQMGIVKNFESAVFRDDGKTLYVADKGGKLRIWGQAHSFTKQGKGERLENYLNRQAPDFLVELPSIEGTLAASGTGLLFVAGSDGIVSSWDPKKPGEIHRLMKVKGTVKSMQATAKNVVTTSKSGYLKVGRVDPPSYLPWSKDVKADYVAISEFTGDDFVMLDGEGVKMKNLDSGENTWTLALPEGPRCGLDVSDDGHKIAACVGNMVYLISGSGTLLSNVYVKGNVEWVR